MMLARFQEVIGLSLLSLWLAGCAVTSQITNTPRSTIEQQLLVRALERAMATLDVQPFVGKTVAVEFAGLTPDKDFAREYFIAWLESQHVRVTVNPSEAQLRLKVFASVLGVDQGQSFIGAPAFTVPLIGFTMPEITVFKDVKHNGYAEIKISTTDAATGDFVGESAPGIGKSNHDDYTLLIIVHFTRSDLEKDQWDLGA
jgi:hypothetical protein